MNNPMICTAPLTRPSTFAPDQDYLWLERQPYGEKPARIPVRFVAYDPCPAFIIVRNGDGSRKRCPREELFEISQSP